MKKSLWILALGSSMLASTCSAQPADGPGLANNPTPADIRKQALDQAMAQARNQADAVMNMTPAQRRDWLGKIMVQQFSILMKAADIAPEHQERVLAFVSEQNVERSKLRESAARVRDAVADKAMAPEQIAALVADYEAALLAERERKAKADAGLVAEVKLATNPKLDGFLRLHGVIGDGPWLVGGIMTAMTSLAALPERAELEAPAAPQAPAAPAEQ